MRRLEASPHCAATIRYALETSWHMFCCVAWLLHARWSNVHTMFRLLIGLAHPVCPSRLCLRKPSFMKGSTPKQSSFPVPLLCFALIATHKRLLLNMIVSRLPASQVKLRLWPCRCVQQCFHVCCNLAASLLVRTKSLPCCQQALCQKEVSHKLLAGAQLGTSLPVLMGTWRRSKI